MAQGVLDYMKEFYPDVYEDMEYTIIELSTAFWKIQKERLGHHKNFRTVNKSIVDWDYTEHEEAFVIAFEVLDNMPHDKVTFRGKQVMVNHTEDGQPFEETQEVEDELIAEYQEILRDYSKYWKE